VELIEGSKTEQQKALLLEKMLGQPCKPEAIADALYWAHRHKSLSYAVLNTLLEKLQGLLTTNPKRLKKVPSIGFKEAFPDCETPQARALLEVCYLSINGQEEGKGIIPALTFWERFNSKVLPDCQPDELAVMTTDEFAEAMHELFSDPDRFQRLIVRLPGQDVQTVTNVLRAQLFAARAEGAPARNDENVSKALQVLGKYFQAER
jgi:hypothetical protein